MGTEKKVDLPPKGRRNADPVTDQPGSHPIETGVGAALAGAASGLAAGAVGGPIAAAVGTAAGAVAGGLAGKSVGEMIDPTTEDNWLRDNFALRPYVQKGETFETYHPAYLYVLKPNPGTVTKTSRGWNRNWKASGITQQRRRRCLGHVPGAQSKMPTIAVANFAEANVVTKDNAERSQRAVT